MSTSVLSNVKLLMIGTKKTAENPPLIGEVRSALTARGFDAARADDIPAATAFRRAVKEKEDKEHKSVCWTNGVLHGQLDRLIPDGEGEGAKLHRQRVAHWRLIEDANAHTAEVGAQTTSGVWGTVIGPPLDVQAAFERYTWADLAPVVRECILRDGLGSYVLRPGVWVVPTAPSSADMLDRLKGAMASVGLSLLEVTVPDTLAHRTEIEEAICAGLGDEINDHVNAIACSVVETTRAGIVRNRHESIVQTRQLIGRLAPHLGERVAPLLQRCVRMEEQCGDMIGRIEAHRPVNAGRRVMVNAPVASPSLPL